MLHPTEVVSLEFADGEFVLKAFGARLDRQLDALLLKLQRVLDQLVQPVEIVAHHARPAGNCRQLCRDAERVQGFVKPGIKEKWQNN